MYKWKMNLWIQLKNEDEWKNALFWHLWMIHKEMVWRIVEKKKEMQMNQCKYNEWMNELTIKLVNRYLNLYVNEWICQSCDERIYGNKLVSVGVTNV